MAQPSRAQPVFGLKRSLAAGAVLAALLGIAAYWHPQRNAAYSTPVGGFATVPLDDGSKITLNTASEITLAISARERRVNLKRGEAFFDVARDAKRPFVVHANGQRIVAIGTKFAVRLKPGTVQVSVTEGKVRLEEQPALLLTAGTIADAHGGKISIRQQPLADVEQSLGWRSGYVVLRKATLADAVSEFNRYNRRKLVIEDPSLADIRVGGNFQSGNVDGFVRLLQEGFAVRAEERGERIVLKRKAAL